jgi:opacity protein-like surface antigen
MEHLRGSIAAVLVVVLVCCVISAVPGLAQPGDAERRLYVGTMVAVPFAQDLHHQTSFILPETSPVLPGAELSAAGDMEIGYGLGFAAILGREISTYAALELTGSWSKQPADLVVSLPAILMQGFSNSDLELPAGFSFAGKIVILQSKIDLLIYPTKIATDSGGAQPYLGGGVGIVRSDIDMDIEKDVPTQAFIEELEESGFAELLPQKIDDTGTDFQLALRAGVNIPFNNIDLDLGWQFYRTYVEGEDNNSHVAGGILKYSF